MAREAPQPPHRKLVSVRHVSLIKPLPSSETHEVVMVDGWPVIVEKGQFSVNQQVLYFALDCVIPELERRYDPYRFSLFSIKLHGEAGWVVQTVKHKDHISQGMVFGLDDSFPEVARARAEVEESLSTSLTKELDDRARRVEEELMKLDLMDDFQVKKWTTFFPRDGGIILGPGPPSFLPATKFERAQNMPDLWKTYGSTEFQITEILDGIPMIFYDAWEADEFHSQIPGWDDHSRLVYGISSGKYDYDETESSISWKAAREQGIVDHFYGTSGGMAVAGVLCGSNILGNPHRIDGGRFYVYGVSFYDYGFKTWMSTDNFGQEWHDAVKKIEPVPKFATGVLLSAFARNLDELVKQAQGSSIVSRNSENKYLSPKRKGLMFMALDGSINFKIIANDWLLDETEKLRKAGADEIVSRPGPDDCV